LVLGSYEADLRYFDGEPLLHGRKAGRLVHVGEATRPFHRDMLGPILAAAARTLDKRTHQVLLRPGALFDD
jgi:hypothetical protein